MSVKWTTAEQILDRITAMEAKILRVQDTTYTRAEAAKYLGIAVSTLDALTSGGKVVSYQPGGKVRVFYKSDLDAYITGK